MDKPLVKSVNDTYSQKLLQYNGYEIVQSLGAFHKVFGFDKYNYLIDINSVFSNYPRFDPVDRTGQALGPIQYAPERPWTIPHTEINLESALQQRVKDLCAIGQPINLLWSGGIDSTAMVAAFLQYAPDIKQCKIVYSPWSTYEHPEFYQLLKNIAGLELLDTSGEFYLHMNLNGIFVSGNTSDEIHASIDLSFLEAYKYDSLFTPWQDFFYKLIPNQQFIDFCQQHFQAAGRDIVTVLDARWWFYASCKLTSILNSCNLSFFTAESNTFDPNRLVGFFDCDCYEQFIYFNLDRIIESDNYATWRQFLKDFVYQYDHNDTWRRNKQKFNSNQIQVYTFKKQILNDSRNLMLLEDGNKVATPNLPFFSRLDWENIKSQYQHVFREPCSV